MSLTGMGTRRLISQARGTSNGKYLFTDNHRYGLALRDHDIDLIRVRNTLVNRYPLMDVSHFLALIF